jgi:hypothetical protein
VQVSGGQGLADLAQSAPLTRFGGLTCFPLKATGSPARCRPGLVITSRDCATCTTELVGAGDRVARKCRALKQDGPSADVLTLENISATIPDRWAPTST